MPKKQHRLVVSFVGRLDLEVAGLVESRRNRGAQKHQGEAQDEMPVLRLIRGLHAGGRLTPEATILLLDDRPDEFAEGATCSLRESFGEVIRQRLKEEYLSYVIRVVPLRANTSDPTNLTGIFEAVRDLLKGEEWRDYMGSVVFHLSSGTPAMYASQFLAALTLTSDAEIWQTSREKSDSAPAGAEQVPRDFVIGIRRATQLSPPRRAPDYQFRKQLAKSLVVTDAPAAEVFHQLYNLARRRKKTNPATFVVLTGSAGCGKWEAARQYADWCDGASFVALRAADLPVPATLPTTLLIRHLNTWSADDLDRLTAWRNLHPDVTVVSTWNLSKQLNAKETQRLTSLSQATQMHLPDASARSDAGEVAKCMLQTVGLHAGKFDERLLAYVLKGLGWSNFHSLKQLLLRAGSLSDSGHIGQLELERQLQVQEGPRLRWMMHELTRRLAEGDFVLPGRGDPLKLPEIINALKYLALRLAASRPEQNQNRVASAYGLSPSAVSEWLNADKSSAPDQQRVVEISSCLEKCLDSEFSD